MGSVSCGNKLTEPYTISSTLEDHEDKSLKNRHDMFEWIRSTKTVEGANKPESQWSNDERRVVNQDQRLKSIIISCLPDDIMGSVMSCEIAKATWTDLVHSFEDYKIEYKKVKAKLALLEAGPFTTQSPKPFLSKNKGMVTETFDWDEEEVSDDGEMTQVKVLMDLVDDELSVGNNHARNAKLETVTFQLQNIELIKQNYALQEQLKEEKLVNDKWLNSSNKIPKTKAKPFPPCTYYGFNDQQPDDYHNYPECAIYGSYDHSTSRHNRVILVKGGEKIQATKAREPTKRSMTGVKSYLYKYVEQPGPKVVFGDNSSCITNGYGSINCGVIFDDKQGTIFNANKEIVLIAPRRNDVYVLDMSSLTLTGACFFVRACFFAKASESVNVFNTRIKLVEETYHVTFDESMEAIRFTNTSVDEIGIDDSSRYLPNNQPNEEPSGNNYETLVPIIEPSTLKVTRSQITHHASTSSYPAPQDRWSRDQHIELVNIIGEPTEGMLTRSMAAKLIVTSASECLFVDFLSEIKPKKTLVPLSKGNIAIGSKWVFKNKKDELGIVTRNKARLVAQGYSREEGIDYDETFAPIARMEAIRIFLAFATYMNFKVFQIDVKSAFLNRKLKEEVFVKQPPGFESSGFPDFVCKLYKAFYGLKQAPRVCSLVKTPMVSPNNLGPDLAGKLVNETLYRGMLGSMMYVTASRSDIQFSTCLCARYHANLKESHIIAVKRISRDTQTMLVTTWTEKAPQVPVNCLEASWYVRVQRNNSQWLCPLLRLSMLLLLGVVQTFFG
ncbi:retrovirus-related pol polyprotein from transposon TNT 1-94 [Tanacetum coccineum]